MGESGKILGRLEYRWISQRWKGLVFFLRQLCGGIDDSFLMYR